MKRQNIFATLFFLLVLSVSAFAQSKTRIIDTIVDSGGNPRKGVVTFILTKVTTTPVGIAPVGASVSAVTNDAGQFDISVYPSTGISPQQYYQVWFADRSNLNRELLGIYNIPTSTPAITLAAYKVTDTALAAQYTFASVTAVNNLNATVATATINAQLLGTSPANNTLQKYDGATGKLSNSAATDDGSAIALGRNTSVTGTLTVSGNLTAPSITTTGGTASGLTITSAQINSSTLTNPTVTTGTFQAPTIQNPVLSGGTASGLTINGSSLFTNGTITNTLLDTGITINNPTITSDLTVGGTIQATGGTFTGPLSLSSPTISGGSISGATITGATFGNTTFGGTVTASNVTTSGTVTAGSFVGNGAGITGLTGATGGVSNTGSTTIAADSDANGVGLISLQTGGVERASIAADGTFNILNLTTSGSFPLQFLHNPAYWNQVRHSANPLFPLAGGETSEMYNPTCVQLSASIQCYTKGANTIKRWASTDGLTTATYSGTALSGTAGWSSFGVVDPTAVYDQANTTIHLYAKGFTSGVYKVGHYTAPASTPGTFTADTLNPILTPAQIVTAFGGTCFDLSISSVIKIGGTFYFYGYFSTSAGEYRMFFATGTSWNNPVPQAIIHTGTADRFSYEPDVFKAAGSNLYTMVYSEGGPQDTARDLRVLRTMTSQDGVTWQRQEGVVLTTKGTGWESNEAFSATIIKKGTGNFDEPALVNNRVVLVYSGTDGGSVATNDLHTVSGVAFLTPGVARLPAFYADAEASNSPALWWYNTFGLAAGVGLSTASYTDGTEMLLGNNWITNRNKADQIIHNAYPAAALRFGRDGSFNFITWQPGDADIVKHFLVDTAGVQVLGSGNDLTARESARLRLTNTVWGKSYSFGVDNIGFFQFADSDGNSKWRFDPGAEGNMVFSTGTLGAAIFTGDVESSDINRGFVLKSPDGVRRRIRVANDGTLSTVAP